MYSFNNKYEFPRVKTTGEKFYRNLKLASLFDSVRRTEKVAPNSNYGRIYLLAEKTYKVFTLVDLFSKNPETVNPENPTIPAEVKNKLSK